MKKRLDVLLVERGLAETRAQAQALIRDAIAPSYQKLLTFMRGEYMPKARKTIDAYSLPDGKAFYQDQIREYTTLDLTPQLVARIAAAKVLVRPLLNSQTQMADTITRSTTSLRPSVSVAQGESRLKPLTANQLDISLEYYHGKGNSISIAGFYKAVKNGTFTQFYCPGSFDGVALNGVVSDCQSADLKTDYSFSRVLNDDRVIHIKGLELGASQNFDAILPVKGFGAVGNVTMVDTDASAIGTGFNLRDLSKLTWNLTPYWENEMFSVRLSVNHRSSYVQDAASSFFVNCGLTHVVRPRTQMDLWSGLVDHSQKMTVAARATAEKKAVGQRS